MLYQAAIVQDPFKFILSSFQVVFKFLSSSFQVAFKLQVGGHLRYMSTHLGRNFGIGHALNMRVVVLVPGHTFRHADCSIGRFVKIMKFQNTSWSLMFLCSGF